jgi:chromate transporter
MNILLVYALLLKATITSFAGLGSLPQIQRDFVETHQVLSAEQLSEAVLIGRSTPGPLGAYVVAVGYFAGGWAGALAGWLALITPALIAVPLVVMLQRWMHLARMRAAVDAIVLASAVLLIATGIRLAIEAAQQLIRVFT